jgi:hypothetical protein
MDNVTTIGLDIAKSVFQVHGVDSVGAVVIRRKLTRGRVLGFFRRTQLGRARRVRASGRHMSVPYWQGVASGPKVCNHLDSFERFITKRSRSKAAASRREATAPFHGSSMVSGSGFSLWLPSSGLGAGSSRPSRTGRGGWSDSSGFRFRDLSCFSLGAIVTSS